MPMPCAVETPRILVVDDDPAVCRAYATVLRRAGYEAYQQESGFGLAVAIRTLRPHLILLDVDLPGLRGPSAVRAAIEVAGIVPPVVLCTGLAPEDVEEDARSIGAVGTLYKPVGRQDLLACVDRVLGNAGLPRAIGG